MGYYSFYKIIKDIIRTIFGKRVFRILLIVLIIMLIGTKVFAVDIETDYNDTTIDVPEDYFDYKFVILYTQENVTGYKSNRLNIYICDDEFSISQVKYSSLYGDYRSTFSPSGYVFRKNFAVEGLNNSDIQNYINQNSTVGTSKSKGDFVMRKEVGTNFIVKFVITNFDASIFGTTYSANASIVKNPELATSLEDLQMLNFDVLSVNAWSYSNEDFDILFYDRNYGSETTDGLYPKRVITLNKDTEYYQSDLTADADVNAIYWIPNTATGLNFVKDGQYSIRFAKRNYYYEDGENTGSGNGSFGDASGGGFRDSATKYTYEYLGEMINFTIDSSVSQEKIDLLNKSTQEETEKKYHDEEMNAINEQKEQDAEFYNNILSNDYDENKADDTLSGTTSSTDSIDDSQYTGLFSAIFGKFSNIINGDYSIVDEIHYPLPNTDKEIIVTSDLLSSKIQGTWIYTFLQVFWLFLFGMYIFKFSNNLIRKIKDGSILNGYENNNEVITSTML